MYFLNVLKNEKLKNKKVASDKGLLTAPSHGRRDKDGGREGGKDRLRGGERDGKEEKSDGKREGRQVEGKERIIPNSPFYKEPTLKTAVDLQ